MSTPTITDPVDTNYLRRQAAASAFGIPDLSERQKIADAADEIDRLRELLDGPCGSCHPCMNWSAEVLRAAIEQHRDDVHSQEWEGNPADERLWAHLTERP